jgi:heme-degrading monooxygenase HmoA
MIIREWRGRAAKLNAEAYPQHFRTKVVPELQQAPGFVGADLDQRTLNDKIEYLVLTKWHSMDVIRSFAGSDVGKAVVEPGAVAARVDFDDRVDHYEVVETI